MRRLLTDGGEDGCYYQGLPDDFEPVRIDRVVTADGHRRNNDERSEDGAE
jgi:hypothetical protein